MAIVDSSNSKGKLRGKLGGPVYSLQPNGTITARSLGVQTAESTQAEQKSQTENHTAQKVLFNGLRTVDSPEVAKFDDVRD